MKSRFLITNRRILNEVISQEGNLQMPPSEELKQEKIARDGKEEAGLHTRYARIQPEPDLLGFKGDPNDIITLYPHRENDDTDFTVSSKIAFGSSAMFSDLHKEMCSTEGGDLLIYVHGYNCDLDSALKNIGIIEDKYIRAGSPIKHLLLFTWPAQDQKIKYKNDIRDTVNSGAALARNILKLQTFLNTYFAARDTDPCRRKIHLLAHSTGARVLEHAMVYLKNNSFDVNIRNIFQEVILAAADVDDFAMEIDRPMAFLSQISERIHSYNHKRDVALFISKTTKNPYPRLGQKGVRNFANLPSNLILIDATSADEVSNIFETAVSHWYYYTAKDIVNDIIEVFKGIPAADIGGPNPVPPKRTKFPDKSNLYWVGESQT